MQERVIDNWCKKEFASVKLNDKRLENRLLKIASSFAELPESSINQSCSNWADTKAAYRFFENERVNESSLLSSHIENTVKSISDHEVILAIQDTSYFTYSSHKKTKGLCVLSRKVGKNVKNIETKGLIMHTSFAVSSDGLALGLLDQKIYSRKEMPVELKEKKKKSHGNCLTIEDKESIRWLEGLQNTEIATKQCSQNIITVCDREADIYDFFELAQKLNSSVLVRAGQKNRVVNKKSRYSKESEKLWKVIKGFPWSGNITVEVPATDKVKKRTAKLEISFGKFIMNPSKNNARYKTEKLIDLPIYAVYVFEKNPPEHSEPLEWILLTNIEVKNFSEAIEKIRWYCLRWRIEVFHKILKSGLKVEECRLNTALKLIKYLTVMSIIAWRIFHITLIARSNPNLKCTALLSEIEWKILYVKIHKRFPPDNLVPTIKDAVIWIARLGGYLARTSDPDPGPIVLWRGLKRLYDIISGYKTYALMKMP